MRTLIVLAALFGLASWDAGAQDLERLNGTNLLPHCRALIIASTATPVHDKWREGICLGLVASTLAHGPYLTEPFQSCPPKGATYMQALTVVVEYLNLHPKKMEEDLGFLVTKALAEAWPRSSTEGTNPDELCPEH
jgi:hypothetical protein